MRHASLRSICLALFAALATVVANAQIDENNTYNPRKDDDYGRAKTEINSRNIRLRDDLLWHAESAGLVYRGAGNVSLLSASRVGVGEHLEFSTYVVEDVIRPSLYAKILWNVFDKRWFLSSRFDVANAYPGMRLAQRFDVGRVIHPEDDIPMVFEMGHELLLSRAWFTDLNCSDGSVYLILTAGWGIYTGINFSDAPNVRQTAFHFLANRSATLTGSGFRSRFKLWADGRITDRFKLHGGLYYHLGSFTKHNALELQGEAEYFFFSRFSTKIGFLTSFANYNNVKNKAAIWPIVDLTYYFGNRRLNSRTLFQRGVYKPGRL